MAFKFADKRKTTQEEMTYIVYMIISSYFKKARCISKQIEDRLYLYYAEMKASAQISREKRIIEQVGKTLKVCEHVFSEMNCEVLIYFRDEKYVLDFITGFEEIHAEVNQEGNCEIKLSL